MATIEEICQIADQNGIGESFREIMETAIRHGLLARPHENGIRFAPPQDKRRYLLTIWGNPVGEHGGILLDIYPDGFSEFYNVSQEEARQILGDSEKLTVEETPIAEVSKLTRSLNILFQLIQFNNIGNTQLRVTFKKKTFKYADVAKAVREFDEQYPNPDDYDKWVEKDGYKYALEFAGKLYPPKHILSVVTGIDVSEFSGGDQTNNVFRKLGLVIVNKPGFVPPSETVSHTTYLLTWNPSNFGWNDFQEDWENVYSGNRPYIEWSCGNTRRIHIGERVFLMRLGWREPITGILASGYVTGEPVEGPHWSDDNRRALYIEFEPDVLLNPETDNLLDPALVSTDFNWHPQSSGVTIPSEVAAHLEQVWQRHIQAIGGIEPAEQNDKPESHTYVEGARKLVAGYRYERDPNARAACIKHYGTKCAICEFDFGADFGSIGEGYIHVHHRIPISEREAEYTVDPVKDLLPVCPNCHAMLHRRSPAYSVEELKLIRQQIRNAKSSG